MHDGMAVHEREEEADGGGEGEAGGFVQIAFG